MSRSHIHDHEQHAIFGPFFVMIFLTIIVWVYMYIRRIRFLTSINFKPDKSLRPEDLARMSPPAVANPSDNLKNLFEMPVIFYALVLYLFVTKQVDTAYVIAAWIYVFFRVLHSLMHCTLNIIMVRFYLYLFSCLSLFFMVFRAMFAHFSP